MHVRAWTGCPQRSFLRPEPTQSHLVDRLRAAGCVFAEDEARILLEAAGAQAAGSPAAGAQAASAETSKVADGTHLEALVRRRIAGEPLEQIVGWVEFAGRRLRVVPGVFVPRQRTVLLAELTMHALSRADTEPSLLEAFCGVGPVAATVAQRMPGTTIHLGDHDLTALECAQTNVGPEAHAHRLKCLEGLPAHLAAGFGVISAVPPYVPEDAAAFLPREAADHELATALFGGVDGLDLVRDLITTARDWLAPDGALLIELGAQQAEAAADYGRDAGFTPRAHLGDDEQTVVLELR